MLRFLSLILLLAFQNSFSRANEDDISHCKCPRGMVLLCSDGIKEMLKGRCSHCLESAEPSSDSKHSKEKPCVIKRNVMSLDRPPKVLRVKIIPCKCVHEKSLNKPVCASNFVSYPSQCVMDCTMPELTKKSDGYCQPHPKSFACKCSEELKPVCGSNGVVYSNECLFNCFKNKNNAEDMKILHEDHCTPKDSPFIPKELEDRRGSSSINGDGPYDDAKKATGHNEYVCENEQKALRKFYGNLLKKMNENVFD